MNQWSPVEVKAGDNIVYFDQGLMKMVEAVVIKKANVNDLLVKLDPNDDDDDGDDDLDLIKDYQVFAFANSTTD